MGTKLKTNKGMLDTRSQITKNNWDNLSEEEKKHKLRGLLSRTSEQYKSQAIKGGISRRGIPSPFKNIPRSEKDKEAISQAVKKVMADFTPEKKVEMNRKRNLTQYGRRYFQLHPEIARQNGINFWKDPEKASRLIGHKPNKAEVKLDELLQRYFPYQWKYVGNGKVWLGHRCPDFINVNGKKQLIELFGIHWHNALSSSERSYHFSQFGFNTLVIWEEELRNELPLVKKIKSFTRR